MVLLVVFLLAGAAWCFFICARPDVGFFLEEGWKFRDAEPSDFYLGMTRVGAFLGGIACIVMAIALPIGAHDSGDADDASSSSTDWMVDSMDGADTPSARPSDRRQSCWYRSIRRQIRWTPKGRVANPKALKRLQSEKHVIVTIGPVPGRPRQQQVTIRSRSQFVEGPEKVVITRKNVSC